MNWSSVGVGLAVLNGPFLLGSFQCSYLFNWVVIHNFQTNWAVDYFGWIFNEDRMLTSYFQTRLFHQRGEQSRNRSF